MNNTVFNTKFNSIWDMGIGDNLEDVDKVHTEMIDDFINDLLIYDSITTYTSSFEDLIYLSSIISARDIEHLLSDNCINYVFNPIVFEEIYDDLSGEELEDYSELLKPKKVFISSDRLGIRTVTYKDINDFDSIKDYIINGLSEAKGIYHNWNTIQIRNVASKVEHLTDIIEEYDRYGDSIINTMEKISLENMPNNTSAIIKMCMAANYNIIAKQQGLKKVSAYTIEDNSASSENWQYISKMFEIPDIADLFRNNQVKFKDIIKFRSSASAQQFRILLNNEEYDDGEKLLKELITNATISKRVDKLKTKTIRLCSNVTIGAVLSLLLNPAIGIAAALTQAIIDNTLVEKTLKGSNPIYYIQDLKSLQKN